MSQVNNELQTLITARNEMKLALLDKGQAVTDDIRTYAQAISNIEGSWSGNKEYANIAELQADIDNIEEGEVVKLLNPQWYCLVHKTGVIDRVVYTGDANATASDIVVNKTAYVDGEKITGVYEPPEDIFDVVSHTIKTITHNRLDSTNSPCGMYVQGNYATYIVDGTNSYGGPTISLYQFTQSGDLEFIDYYSNVNWNGIGAYNRGRTIIGMIEDKVAVITASYDSSTPKLNIVDIINKKIVKRITGSMGNNTSRNNLILIDNGEFVSGKLYVKIDFVNDEVINLDIGTNNTRVYLGNKLFRETVNNNSIIKEYTIIDEQHKTVYTSEEIQGNVNGVLFNRDKIIINGNLYSCGIGNYQPLQLLKENVCSSSDFIYCINNTYYCIGNEVYIFNNGTNEFNKSFDFTVQYKLPNTIYNDVETTCTFVDFRTDQTTSIGFEYNGINYYTKSVDLNSVNVLSGTKVADSNGNLITGSMPNNGTLNYTPSVSNQTIPSGYTKGGTIYGVTSDIDINIKSENIKKNVDILGITGSYEGIITEAEYNQALEQIDNIFGEE